MQTAGKSPEARIRERLRYEAEHIKRYTWQEHLKAAVIDLRNTDRSVFEQEVYDSLRIFIERNLEPDQS